MADEIILVLEIEGVGNDLVVIHVSKLLCNILELGDGWDIGWINRGDGEREGGGNKIVFIIYFLDVYKYKHAWISINILNVNLFIFY
jgi:hypothetical protein